MTDQQLDSTTPAEIVAEREEYDPFASTADIPRVVDKERHDGIGDAQGVYDAFASQKPPKVKMKRDAAQFARACSYMSKLYPDVPFWEKCEYTQTLYGGMQVKRDWWGFGDVQGMQPYATGSDSNGGRMIVAQITTVDQVLPHLRKYTDTSTKSLNEIPTLTKLRHFLTCGNVLVILGYEKIGSRWECRHMVVTIEMLDETIKRKRK